MAVTGIVVVRWWSAVDGWGDRHRPAWPAVFTYAWGGFVLLYHRSPTPANLAGRRWCWPPQR
jgi:hypothetical protein